MAYKTLYRKYRPKTFSLVFGQDPIIKTIKNIILKQKLSHAYLFTGPRGTGKTSSAKLFAKAINCLNNSQGDACNECENCKSFNNGTNPDIIEIDAASNNGVDEIREIKNNVSLVPSMSKYKVYIIDEVHMLSMGAFNALLKTLEEPPEYVIFILATTEPQKIPATIISRCQRFDFKNIDFENMKNCLRNIIEKESIDIENDALEEIVKNSNGGMRDAISLLDQASVFSEKRVLLKDVEELSGNISNDEVEKLVLSIINQKYDEIFNLVSQFSQKAKDFSLITDKITNYIRNGILYKKKAVKIEQNSLYNDISDTNLYIMFDFFVDLNNKIKQTYQKNLIFEVAMIQLSDKLVNKSRNVPRETLNKKTDDVSRETSEKKEENIPKKKSNTNLIQLKFVRINNILKDATKKDFNFIKDLWDKIEDYFIDDKYKTVAGMLKEATPVAASKEGIIITIPYDAQLSRLEKEYDLSKELLSEIFNQNSKIVYITNDYWQEIRPEFVNKIREGKLVAMDETEVLNKIKEENEANIMNEFNDLIEMEEK